MVAEFEADLIRIAHARRHGGRQGQGPAARQAAQAQPRQEAHLVELYRAGESHHRELAELFGVARSTVYRALQRNPPVAAAPVEM